MIEKKVVGVISDTHSLLRPEALAELCDSDVILHAGDVGNPTVLDELGALAPVYVVRGNIDRASWADALPHSECFEFAGKTFYMVHDPADIEIDPVAAQVDVVITGHTHKPKLEEKDGVVFLNPGSAGPRRFKLPIGLARIEIENGDLAVELVPLNIS